MRKLLAVFAFLLALLPAAASAAAPPAVVPGSPLAAIAAALPAPGASTPAPFGTDTLGFPLAGLSRALAHGAGNFLATMGQRLRPAPVLDWLSVFPVASWQLPALDDMGLGLLLVLLPGLAADIALRLALRGPRRFCAAKAVPSGTPTLQSLADAEAGETEPHPRRVSLRAGARRLAFALAVLVLELLPLAAFALVLALLLDAGLPGDRAARLAVTGAGNAYLVMRGAWELLRFFAAPNAPPLRLLPLADGEARTLCHGALLLLGTALVAYMLISAVEILGLPREGGEVLARYAMLLLHLELALFIWRGRRVVARWLAGSPEAASTSTALRRFAAATWHYVALFYVLALWVAWVGGVHNAVTTLLRVVAVLVVAVVAGRLAWLGSAALLERGFSEGEAPPRHPVLAARARAYSPLLRLLLHGAILAAVIVVILEGWGLNALGWLLGDPLSRLLLGAVLSVVITVAVAVALWEAANFVLHDRIARLTEAGEARQAARLRTLGPILRAAAATLIVLVALFVVLSEIGVNAPSLAAGAGVVGIAIGFGSQKLVQDIITGLFLLAEDVLQVGDYVSLGGVTGTVEHLSIRTIRLRGVDGSMNVIPFSSVTNVTNMTRDFGMAQLAVRVAYGADIDRVFSLLREIARDMQADPAWTEAVQGELQIFGLDEFATLGLIITAQLRTAPGKHWAVKHEFLRLVLLRFTAEGIGIPHDNTTYLAGQGS